MKHQSRQIIFIALIGLAAVGLITTSPGQLLQMLGMVVIFGVIFYFLFRFLQRRNGSGNWKDQSRYKKAVLQSKKRYQKQQKSAGLVKKASTPSPIKRKSNAQLTVIEGKKNNKKKNRALH